MNTRQRIGLFVFILALNTMNKFPDVLDASNIHKFELFMFLACLGAVGFVFPEHAT